MTQTLIYLSIFDSVTAKIFERRASCSDRVIDRELREVIQWIWALLRME